MRRGRIFIFIALLLIIGLAVAAFVFNKFFSSGPETVEQPPTTMTKVYIAGQNIPQGEIITEEVLATIDIPQESVVSVMYTADQKTELIGKTAKYPIAQGVLVTSETVSDGALATSGPQWAAQIPQGMTAVSIPTTRLESVAFGVQDGAHVDISACFLFVDVDPSFQSKLPNQVAVLTSPVNVAPDSQPGVTLGVGGVEGGTPQGRTEVESAFQQGIYVVPSEGQRPRLVCQMILQNVVILKMGSFSLRQAQSAPTEPADPNAPPPPVEIPDLATLIVSPQDSVTMSYLIYSGAKITMTLRNALDESRVATEAATLQFLLSQYNIPVPAKLPYTMEPNVDSLNSQFIQAIPAQPVE